jgi:hypothetical protein
VVPRTDGNSGDELILVVVYSPESMATEDAGEYPGSDPPVAAVDVLDRVMGG